MNYIRNSANYVWSTSYVLGKGATGSVYQGLHKKTGEAVAVKTFNPHSHLRPLEVQMREFEVMKVLSHENIVKMVAIEDEVQSQKKVLVMELCNGGSLYTILDDPQNSYGLEEEEFLCVLKDMAAGMKYLRDNSTIHRDLKPGNIMKFNSEDGRSIYKLTDFGAARVLDDDQQFMSLYGTEEYLHPDMYERAVLHHPARKPFRATVDLWSIGVTLYHVATGSLPFRPFGGRQNKDTMHYITTNKASGVISGVQHSENGPIEWSKELPKTCLLNQGLRDLVTELLAGILECNDKLMWTFDQFFNKVTDIFSRKVFHIFYMNDGKEICLYLKPNKSLEDLKDQIQVQTKVSISSQLLLFDKTTFVSQIDPTAEVSTFPSTSLDQPLILVHMENTNVKDLTRLGAMSACFPNFPSAPVSTDNDASLARTCCSVAHAVKRLVVKLVRCRELLLRIPKILILLSFEHVTKICSNSEVLNQKMEDASYRSELLDRSCSVVKHFVLTWRDHDDFEEEIMRLDRLATDQKKLNDQVKQKIMHLLSAIHILSQKVRVSKRLQNEWDQALAECSSLTGCVERADTYVGKMRDSWQVFVRDKAIKVLSPHDNQFHMLERVKVQQTSKKLLSLLQDQCLQACLQASNRLDEWYSGMQATMVQSRCLEVDLNSANNDLKNFCTAQQKAELETYQMSEKLALLKSASLHVNGSNCENPDNVSQNATPSFRNGEIINDPKARSYKKVLSQIKILQNEQASLWEIAEENNSLINEFCSLLTETAQEHAAEK